MTTTNREECIAEAVRLYTVEGWNLKRCGAHLGVDLSTVGKWLQAAGVARRRRGAPIGARATAMAEAVAAGASQRSTARAFGVHSSSVLRVCERRGVASTARAGRPRREVA